MPYPFSSQMDKRRGGGMAGRTQAPVAGPQPDQPELILLGSESPLEAQARDGGRDAPAGRRLPAAMGRTRKGRAATGISRPARSGTEGTRIVFHATCQSVPGAGIRDWRWLTRSGVGTAL